MKFKRTKALADKSAWILILPALLALYFVDDAMMRTLVEWVIFAPVLAGVAIVICRIVFPQIHLTELIRQAIDEKSAPAAGLAAAIITFVGMVFFALVLWARV